MLEANNIYLGDSYELIKEIDNNSIDLIMIDPPYQIEGKPHPTKCEISQSIAKLTQELEDNEICDGIKPEILDEFMRVMKCPNIYIWCNKKQIPMYLEYFVIKHKCRFELIVWNKVNAMPLYNNKYLNDVEYCLYFRDGGYCNPATYEEAKTVYLTNTNKHDKDLFLHPTIKPLHIIRTLVKNSTKENDLVLDCFLGSGTTAIACKEINRRFIGIERNEKWYKIAKDRLEGIDADGQCSFLLR